jgi:GAF domain-containing protein
MPGRDVGAAHERWLGAQEAAVFLGVHRSTLHAAARQGTIVPDGRTPGGHMRFALATLERFRDRLITSPATGDGGTFAPVRTLATLAHQLVEPTDLESACVAAVAGVRSSIPGVELCVLAIRAGDDGDDNHLRVAAQEGFPRWVFDEFRRLRGTFKYATTAAMHSRESDFCENVAERSLHAGTERVVRGLGLSAYATLPLVANDEALGVLVCAARGPLTFSDHDRAFLRGVADELAALLARSAERRRLLARVSAGHALTAAAFALRLERHAHGSPEGEPPAECCDASLAMPASERMGARFRDLTGADTVCALGFGRDLPTRDPHLLSLTCQACAGDDLVAEQWTVDGVAYTGAAASVPLNAGRRAGVGAVWRGKHAAMEADHALLVTFAGAYLLGVGSA